MEHAKELQSGKLSQVVTEAEVASDYADDDTLRYDTISCCPHNGAHKSQLCTSLYKLSSPVCLRAKISLQCSPRQNSATVEPTKPPSTPATVAPPRAAPSTMTTYAYDHVRTHTRVLEILREMMMI